jgi:hypothetical protein
MDERDYEAMNEWNQEDSYLKNKRRESEKLNKVIVRRIGSTILFWIFLGFLDLNWNVFTWSEFEITLFTMILSLDLVYILFQLSEYYKNTKR